VLVGTVLVGVKVLVGVLVMVRVGVGWASIDKMQLLRRVTTNAKELAGTMAGHELSKYLNWKSN
jgi:hypothetical protein